MNVGTVDDQSVLKYHISVAAKIAEAAKKASEIWPLFRSTFDFEQIADKHPADVFGEDVCEITNRAKIETTRMSNRICSYFARFKSGPSASEYMEVDRKAERSVNLEMSGLVGIYLYHPDQKYHFELKCQQVCEPSDLPSFWKKIF